MRKPKISKAYLQSLAQYMKPLAATQQQATAIQLAQQSKGEKQ